MNEHLQNCQMSVKPCRFCFANILVEFEEQHLKVCPKVHEQSKVPTYVEIVKKIPEFGDSFSPFGNDDFCPVCRCRVQTFEMNEHLQNCRISVKPCRFCFANILVEFEEQHLKVCPRVHEQSRKKRSGNKKPPESDAKEKVRNLFGFALSDSKHRKEYTGWPNDTRQDSFYSEVPEPVLIPCEICGKLIPVDDITLHTTGCTSELVSGPQRNIQIPRIEEKSYGSYSEHSSFFEGGGSSNILERSTQTESSELLPTKDKSTNTDEEPVNLLETLSNDFSTFYESNIDNDCILKVNKTQFPAHRAVLSARSTVFSAMFHHDTAENRSGEVDIPDVDVTTLSDVLYYIYSGKIRGLTADSAVSMYNLTDKYALLELSKKCMDFLKLNLTMDNICCAAVLAHAHGETELEERVLLFIEDRLEELVQSDKWNELLGIKPILASKLLSEAFMASKNRCIQGKSEK